MLRDNETYSSIGVIQIFGDVLGHGVMLGMDEPVHGRLRSLVTKAFTQKALARWEDEIVGRIGNELIDEFAAERQGGSGQGRSPFPTRPASSPRCSACRRRTSRSSSAGRSRC